MIVGLYEIVFLCSVSFDYCTIEVVVVSFKTLSPTFKLVSLSRFIYAWIF